MIRSESVFAVHWLPRSFMPGLSRHDELEMVIRPTNRRRGYRFFAVLLTALVAFGTFALTPRVGAQNGNGSTPEQQSAYLTAHGVYKVGGDVSAPVLIHSVEPQYPDKIDETNATGTVQVTVWVTKNGLASHIHVTRGLGMGLDEKATEAVRQYRYKPAMKDGEPVMVELTVEVKFQRSAN
jgi:TonB family protein